MLQYIYFSFYIILLSRLHINYPETKYYIENGSPPIPYLDMDGWQIVQTHRLFSTLRKTLNIRIFPVPSKKPMQNKLNHTYHFQNQ